MNQSSKFYLMGFAAGAGIGGMSVLAIMAPSSTEQGASAPSPIALNPSSGPFALRPMIIEMNLLPPEEFAKRPERGSSTGFSHLGTERRRCRIFVPTDIGMLHIEQVPVPWSRNPVAWGTPAAPQLIAHELLHCMIGSWHP